MENYIEFDNNTLNLVSLKRFLSMATTPEEVFDFFPGKPASEMRELVHAAYRRFSKTAHPDQYTDESEKRLAEQAQTMLNGFWGKAEERFNAGVYGTAKPEPAPTQHVRFSTKRHDYIIVDAAKTGGMATLFNGAMMDKAGAESLALIKVPHVAQDNDLMAREAAAYTAIKKKLKTLCGTDEELARKFALRLPDMAESLTLSQPGADKKTVNVFRIIPEYRSGWLTLEEIRKYLPNGVDGRVGVFILNRVLEALTVAHAAGILHCAITPNHVLILPKDHMGQLVDWTASCRNGAGDRVPYVHAKYTAFFPEEISTQRCRPSHQSDIYMAGMCAAYVMGIDVNGSTFAVPPSIPNPIVAFINRCLQPNPLRRWASADIAWRELAKAAESVYGPRKFVDFVVPGAPQV